MKFNITMCENTKSTITDFFENSVGDDIEIKVEFMTVESKRLDNSSDHKQFLKSLTINRTRRI